MRPHGTTTVPIRGVLAQGQAIADRNEYVTLPADRIAPSEVVFRVGAAIPDLGVAAGDLLIVERRRHAATGEVVIATLRDRAFIGRWWTKHGTRMLLDNEYRVIVEAKKLQVFGAVTLIARTTATAEQ